MCAANRRSSRGGSSPVSIQIRARGTEGAKALKLVWMPPTRRGTSARTAFASSSRLRDAYSLRRSPSQESGD